MQEYVRRGETDLGHRINEARWSLVRKYISSAERVLDWGCADGAFIRSSPNGYSVEGYDVNPFGKYRDARLYLRPWDAVTAWDVIEHLTLPGVFVRNLDTQFLFISTPNADAAGEGLLGWKHYKPGEHLHYFTSGSIKTMLARNGFRAVEESFAEGALRDPEHPEAIITVVAKRR